MKPTTVLLIYGGESSEHDISILSAKNVYYSMNPQKHDVKLCFIDRNGKWWLMDDWKSNPEEHRVTQVAVLPGTSQIMILDSGTKIAIDVIFPVLHGKLGEDGTIQGLAEMMHVPVVGCGVEASAIGMNKDATKRLLAAQGIPVAPGITIGHKYDIEEVRRQIEELSPVGPWFVKPSRAGSSVGVTKVRNIDDLQGAIDAAKNHDDTVLIEVAITGRELEVAVLGTPPSHKVSGVGEIFPGNDFYDYEDKYSLDSKSRTNIDADLEQGFSELIRKYAADSYAALGCQGLARVDFLLSEDGTPYVNEINTLPGFTDISMFPKLWEAKGIDQTELVERLIELAVE
ncbi:MAG: D-alanine--D-alanine ligase family protein [Candidatus Saccharimonadales bacterium]